MAADLEGRQIVTATPTDAVPEAEWRAANRAALKCLEIAEVYRKYGGPAANVAITALEAAASAIRAMADQALTAGAAIETERR